MHPPVHDAVPPAARLTRGFVADYFLAWTAALILPLACRRILVTTSGRWESFSSSLAQAAVTYYAIAIFILFAYHVATTWGRRWHPVRSPLLGVAVVAGMMSAFALAQVRLNEWAHRTGTVTAWLPTYIIDAPAYLLRHGPRVFILALLTLAAGYAGRMLAAARDAEVQAARGRRELAARQAQAVRARLQPADLPEILPAVERLMAHDRRAAEDALDRLAILLRASLGSAGDGLVPLHREAATAEAFVHLRQVEAPRPVRMRTELPDAARGWRVPNLLLLEMMDDVLDLAVRAGAGEITLSAAEGPAGRRVLRVEHDGARSPSPAPPDRVAELLRAHQETGVTWLAGAGGVLIELPVEPAREAA